MKKREESTGDSAKQKDLIALTKDVQVVQNDLSIVQNDLVVLRKDIDASMEIKFERFRHDIIGAFRDAVQVFTDRFDRQQKMLMNHEYRIDTLETKVGIR